MNRPSPLGTLGLLGAFVLPLLGQGCMTEKRMERALAHVDLGTAYYREGSYEAAIEELTLAAKTDHRNWRALNALAVAYVAKGETELAEETFAKALRMNPDEAEILLNHGALQLNQGQRKEAIASFQHALQDIDYRNQSYVLSNLAFALIEDGQPDAAVAAAREAVRRTPDLCEGWFHLGLAQEARKDPEAALNAYQEVQRRCPSESLGARLRAGCLQLQGLDPVYGQATLQQVVAEAPDTPFADRARSCLMHGGQP